MDTKTREQQTGHAVASPSQLYRILNCPGSLFEVLKSPISPPSSYAQQGTYLHTITSGLILTKPEAKTMFKNLEIPDKNAVEDCLDFAKDLFGKYENPTIKIEASVDLGSWDMPDIWGTLDMQVSSGMVTHIVDWKFGSGVQVYVQDNEQLLAYAAGAIGWHSGSTESVHGANVFLHIVQPFLNHFDTWAIDYKHLETWVFDVLQPGLKKAQEPNPEYVPGEKQCKFCPAAMTCRARLEESQNTAKDVFRVHSNLAIASKQELASLLKRVRSMSKYIDQIEKYAAVELSQGRSFPNYKLVAGRSTRKWANEDKAEAWLLGNSSIAETDLHSKKFISPAQAEKLDRHLKKDSTFKDLISKPPGKPKMVDEDDPRPAIKPDAEAAKAFGDWQDEEGGNE